MKKLLKALALVSFTAMLGYAGTIDQGGPLLPNLWWVLLSLLLFGSSIAAINYIERKHLDESDKRESAEDSSNCQRRKEQEQKH